MYSVFLTTLQITKCQNVCWYIFQMERFQLNPLSIMIHPWPVFLSLRYIYCTNHVPFSEFVSMWLELFCFCRKPVIGISIGQSPDRSRSTTPGHFISFLLSCHNNCYVNLLVQSDFLYSYIRTACHLWKNLVQVGIPNIFASNSDEFYLKYPIWTLISLNCRILRKKQQTS